LEEEAVASKRKSRVSNPKTKKLSLTHEGFTQKKIITDSDKKKMMLGSDKKEGIKGSNQKENFY
jgi:hypothetical protein